MNPWALTGYQMHRGECRRVQWTLHYRRLSMGSRYQKQLLVAEWSATTIHGKVLVLKSSSISREDTLVKWCKLWAPMGKPWTSADLHAAFCITLKCFLQLQPHKAHNLCYLWVTIHSILIFIITNWAITLIYTSNHAPFPHSHQHPQQSMVSILILRLNSTC